ncbi:MAG: tetratricopeptide repeat protein [Isosphaeraceae bacterium]
MLVELRRFDPALARARQAVIEQDRLGAIKWATSSLERRPSGPEAVRIAAHQLSELLFPDEAEAYYQRLHTLNRFEKQDAHVRALGLTRANQREKAVAAYEEILAGDPTDALALQRLAALQWLRGRSDDALAVAERLAKTSEGAVAGHTILAEVSHEVGRRRDAIVHFRRVLEIDPELRSLTQPQVIFYAQFGGDLLTEGLASEARTVLRKAVETNREPGLFDLMGRACLDDGDPVEAAEWWRRSTEIDPERVAPWLHLGKLALKGGNPAEAAELLNRALSLALPSMRS